jgi:hypothetical protein
MGVLMKDPATVGVALDFDGMGFAGSPSGRRPAAWLAAFRPFQRSTTAGRGALQRVSAA